MAVVGDSAAAFTIAGGREAMTRLRAGDGVGRPVRYDPSTTGGVSEARVGLDHLRCARSSMANESFLQFDGGVLGREQRHVCAFFNSTDEEHRVLRSFIKDGFERGDRAFHLVDPKRRDEHLRRLSEAGIDVQEALGTGQLEVRPWQDGPLRGPRFDQDTWLMSFEEVLQSGLAAGYAQTRFLAHMEWALVDLPGIEDLIEFETRVNYVVPKYDDMVICAYDLSKFGASVMMDALRTHPVVISGLLQENPFVVPPDQFLLELRERGRLPVGGSAALAT
jgi:hypothetical protein